MTKVGIDSERQGITQEEQNKRLFTETVELLRKADPREFYPRITDFCASLLHSDVCALYVCTTQINNELRVCLVAGKLPNGHKNGLRMNPDDVDRDLKKHSYRLGTTITNGDKIYDGVTGKIATTGKAQRVSSYGVISKDNGHMGKWDSYVWQDRPAELFRGMLGVPIFDTKNKDKIVGVIKVENKFFIDENNEYDYSEYTKEDEQLLTTIGDSLSDSLVQLINEHRELKPAITEHEYRVPRSRPEIFEKEKTGEVVIKHSMTAICHSDINYFQHKKSRDRLDDRLPLVLGHETTGEVYQVIGENYYANDIRSKIKAKESLIKAKDKVVVIPLIPCGTCEVCKGDYGQNYCPSSRFMASNAPGSLRTIYKYYPNLILKIENPELEKYALFTEPMSNVVQMLQELGFKKGQKCVELEMAPHHTQEFTYFHVGTDSFTNIFDTITAEEPYPRTLFVLKNPNKSQFNNFRIKHQNLMVKGLGLLGTKGENPTPETKRVFDEPKVLILGGGILGYILAVLLHNVFGFDQEHVVVTGRDPQKLSKFMGLATRHPIGSFLETDGTYKFATNGIVDQLIAAGAYGKYDFVFECAGAPSVGANIDLALRVLEEKGVLALEGLSEEPVSVDFAQLMSKEIFMKGFYRGSIDAYITALEYIEKEEKVLACLEALIDNATPDGDNKTGFHRVQNENELSNLFILASEKKEFGRLIISELD